MSKYKKIQFIAWEVYTGPAYKDIGDPEKPEVVAYTYPGINCKTKDERIDVNSQCMDIQARVEFTKDAIEKAYSKAVADEDVLKIFMAPEFTYRGSGGAYLYDLINGWESTKVPDEFDLPSEYDNWIGLFGKLKQIVADDKYKDWIFIFGTAVGAFFRIPEKGKEKTPLSDIKGKAIIRNMSLIQRGGSKEESTENISDHVAEKWYMSSIDFLEYKSNVQVKGFKKETVENLEGFADIDYSSIVPDAVIGDYISNSSKVCRFLVPGLYKGDTEQLIDFGIEICLDHSKGKLIRDSNGMCNNTTPGILKRKDLFVDIQLVPSCGITLKTKSISLKKDKNFHSYAFNCDGLTRFFDSNKDKTVEEYRKKRLPEKAGTHVQIWESYSNILKDKKDIVEKTSKLKVKNTVDIKVYFKDKPEETRTVNDYELWRSEFIVDPISKLINSDSTGSGFIRVIDPMPLSD